MILNSSHHWKILIGILALLVFCDLSIAEPSKKRILFLGDSLTDGYGVLRTESYPSLILEKIQKENLAYSVQNAGISGDTTAGGLRRIDWLKRDGFDVVIVALGANDGLRGLNPEKTKENLLAIIKKIREVSSEAKIIIGGMLVPTNMGDDYQQKFSSVFPSVVKETDVEFIPFILEGVAAHPELNIADGIHPNSEGHKIIAELVWTKLAPLLREQELPKPE